LFTGVCAYLLDQELPFDLFEAVWMAAGLLLSISGCTALNMLVDRDIDARMKRTASRPIPAGLIDPLAAGAFGGLLSVAGLVLAFGLGTHFGAVVASGFIINTVVYTAWLKRRTPLSIIFGGIAGGMPALAGRVLALGRLDWVGLLLAGSILLWIPSHILTLGIRYSDDYRQAGVPMWPNVYGAKAARWLIAGANLPRALALTACAILLKVIPVVQVLMLAINLGMVGLSILQLARPGERRNWLIFRLASFHMLFSSLLLIVQS
jgi:protoheme IX farnesyltransferase